MFPEWFCAADFHKSMKAVNAKSLSSDSQCRFISSWCITGLVYDAAFSNNVILRAVKLCL